MFFFTVETYRPLDFVPPPTSTSTSTPTSPSPSPYPSPTTPSFKLAEEEMTTVNVWDEKNGAENLGDKISESQATILEMDELKLRETNNGTNGDNPVDNSDKTEQPGEVKITIAPPTPQPIKFNPFRSLIFLSHPFVFLTSVSMGVAFGVMFTFETILPDLFEDTYGLNSWQVRLFFLLSLALFSFSHAFPFPLHFFSTPLLLFPLASSLHFLSLSLLPSTSFPSRFFPHSPLPTLSYTSLTPCS
jgi:hypothetical protein